MSKQQNLFELVNQLKNNTTTKQKINIEGKEYIVVSHYVGNKDIDQVINRLAIKSAYIEK